MRIDLIVKQWQVEFKSGKVPAGGSMNSAAASIFDQRRYCYPVRADLSNPTTDPLSLMPTLLRAL
ncbi:MAG: hypothetical protein Q8S20_14590, partial [Sulfuritalea sp.]|nr:hypothetical protein [Sulfuritalea sp.]